MSYQIEIQTKVGEAIPYDLLLLADEDQEAINKYIHESVLIEARIKDETQLIGVLALNLINENVLEIKNIAVAPANRKQGIGRQLVEAAIAYAKQHNFIDLIVGTGDQSFDAFSFYRKMQFEPYGVRPNFFVENYKQPIIENGHPLKDMVMFKLIIEPTLD